MKVDFKVDLLYTISDKLPGNFPSGKENVKTGHALIPRNAGARKLHRLNIL